MWVSTAAWVHDWNLAAGAGGKPRGSSAGVLTRRQREALSAVKRLQPTTGEPGVSLAALAAELGSDGRWVSKRLQKLVKLGHVRNLEIRGHGAPARFVPADKAEG